MQGSPWSLVGCGMLILLIFVLIAGGAFGGSSGGFSLFGNGEDRVAQRYYARADLAEARSAAFTREMTAMFPYFISGGLGCLGVIALLTIATITIKYATTRPQQTQLPQIYLIMPPTGTGRGEQWQLVTRHLEELGPGDRQVTIWQDDKDR